MLSWLLWLVTSCNFTSGFTCLQQHALLSGQCKQSKLQVYRHQSADEPQVRARQHGLPKQRWGNVVAGRSGSAPLSGLQLLHCQGRCLREISA